MQGQPIGTQIMKHPITGTRAAGMLALYRYRSGIEMHIHKYAGEK